MSTRRLTLRRLAWAAVLGGQGVQAVLQQVLAAGNQPQAPGMRRISGTVTINGQPAQIGQLVAPGDTVVTGPGAQAVYIVGRNAYLQRESSTVGLAAELASGVLRVISGKVLSVFALGNQQRVETPTATIGIRGTGCYVEAEPERVYFCLCYGKAEVVPLSDASQTRQVETRYHDMPFYIYAPGVQRPPPAAGVNALPGAGPGGLMDAAPVINHGDAELVMLEALVGRRPPFMSFMQPGQYRY